ncbi:exo-beta-N-acetylmuramidase NamZ domain-containing protein [Paenibacillus sp. NPDC056579]|uniref:exo-beta-N-acetylmuramidase NamZ family protein n=1 Tax=Paenibacillus sp. NPDC056579 TaxID=3345871 RepID=UPI0036BCF68A
MTYTCEVVTGADRLLSLEKEVIGGLRIGLLTNPTGITSRFESLIDVCGSASSAVLTALFACEHGIRGEKQAGVLFEDETDPLLGIPVFSLYGTNKKPTEEMMSTVDAVIFDIQDLGVRFYTYLTTLAYMLEACAQYGKRLVVLDRPNPLGGIVCEGGLLQPGFESMVGAGPVPFRTGLTIGEFARYFNSRLEKPCELQVIPMLNWRRGMEYPATGLPWLMPSPNMPTMDTVRVYAGHCLFEGTNVSEGRGTTRPFELIGAPWIDGRRLCERMSRLQLPGVHYHPVTFTPMFSKHQGQLCGGVQAFVTSPGSYRSVMSALYLLHTVIDMHPTEFEWIAPFKEGRKPFIDYLSGSDAVRTAIHKPEGLQGIISAWDSQTGEWERTRQPYLLYGVDA